MTVLGRCATFVNITVLIDCLMATRVVMCPAQTTLCSQFEVRGEATGLVRCIVHIYVTNRLGCKIYS